MKTKTCPECNRILPAKPAFFHRHRGGLHKLCKQCRNQHLKRLRELRKNDPAYREYQRNRRPNSKRTYIRFKIYCSNCGKHQTIRLYEVKTGNSFYEKPPTRCPRCGSDNILHETAQGWIWANTGRKLWNENP